MEYNFLECEAKWQKYWAENGTFRAENGSKRPKFYALDMFPYPSGSGLHVGHPLGYIASDIYARFKRHNGYNVLHPMGYDAFGLPAEQYAIETGQHPALTTEENINRYREQLDKIGFSFDWSREVKTSDPKFYKWTQWIFVQLFHSWYNKATDKAESISTLITEFEDNGSHKVDAAHDVVHEFSAEEWSNFSEKQQRSILLNYRLAFRADTIVNWCPALGTVLANDEVVNGVSERGGHPVIQREMKQWSLRITAYADRLLNGLDRVEWSDSIKEIQRNWIGKSVGAEVDFPVQGLSDTLKVFTTRPDTIFGATFMVLAPEHQLVDSLTTDAQKKDIETYLDFANGRSERERMAEVKDVTGAFTGSFAENPITGTPIPIWISDYVLAGYGTGAIMAVPSGDQRDWDFAKKFDLPIIPVIEGHDISEGADDRKDGIMINSGFLDGKGVKEAIKLVIDQAEDLGIGIRKVNYKLRDAVFSRQRYWGEPFPIYYREDIPFTIDEDKLPLPLPEIDEYKPTEDGDPPLGRAATWNWDNVSGKLMENGAGYPIELSTMPGWAGSSWYFLRYMMEGDPEARSKEFASKDSMDYWGPVDLYIGGAEHATGHLLYFRFWTKFLHDLNYISFDEPATKLINQGMIQAEDGQKMSKRYGNVVNPDDIVTEHSADALRLHEMFLGPIEMHKPWNTKGIEGVSKFMRKMWRLFHNENNELEVSNDEPSQEEHKALHKCIQKVSEDMERFSLNTSVSAFMVMVNELTDLNCNKRAILEPATILVSCHAPHITEELWNRLGHDESISESPWPTFNPDFLIEDSHRYPVSFNGKTRFQLELPTTMNKEEVEAEVLANDESKKWLDGKTPKKVIVVPGRIVNVVV
ncbi:MAG: leucine--tRNA ligase [Flavobacteriales bacterium]|jgi:leucyl-tRNA synthetase|nr:leucine--tRNA ligase [Flavobacteriales bacterium]MBT4705115.1 leucine--tRNA ligase [Flavobacteriales bacterium]MBT4930135.1 leucine--tRNA ligase [Flavobacteriales bacterium]MBT5133093.1 leucine--tRNA ligase [Flavobacteriales bacterium]MBT6133687.1 leucine--tRNA ligase [Flavobacteriales bacterium]